MQQKCTKFPERLTELREGANLSRQQLADILGVSRASLEYYEKGKRTPDIDVLYKLSEHFNVTSDYLIGRTDKQGESTDINAICNYTGLSEKAVKILKDMQPIYEYNEIISFLIEETEYRRTPEGIFLKENLIDLLKSFYFYSYGKQNDDDQRVYVSSLGHIYTSVEQFDEEKVKELFDEFRGNKKLTEIKFSSFLSRDLLDSAYISAIIDHLKESKIKFLDRGVDNAND